VGLAAACDVVLADENASFALPELLLGLTPATILPVLLGRLSAQQVRLSALQGKSYDARAAHAVGLVDEVVGAGELDAACRRWERTLFRVDLRAVAQLKRLVIEDVGRQGEAIRRGAALTASALTDETVLRPLRAFWRDGTPPWEGR
jgi:enoyl-CoA hydratase/carnithine racemase